MTASLPRERVRRAAPGALLFAARIVRGVARRSRLLLADYLDRRAAPVPVPDGAELRYRLLFVCYGNSCRSPLAEGIFRARLAAAGLLGPVEVDSAGTHAGDPGAPPDLRARAVARRHGIGIGDLRARRFELADFDRFDRIVVFDSRNLQSVLELARGDDDRAKVALLLDDGDVADPVLGARADFERVYEQLDAAADRLLADVQAQIRPR